MFDKFIRHKKQRNRDTFDARNGINAKVAHNKLSKSEYFYEMSNMALKHLHTQKATNVDSQPASYNTSLPPIYPTSLPATLKPLIAQNQVHGNESLDITPSQNLSKQHSSLVPDYIHKMARKQNTAAIYSKNLSGSILNTSHVNIPDSKTPRKVPF